LVPSRRSCYERCYVFSQDFPQVALIELRHRSKNIADAGSDPYLMHMKLFVYLFLWW